MNKTKFTLTIFITLFILSSVFTLIDINATSIHQVSGLSPLQTQLDNAASYLLSRYNSILGLVANSEDEGLNPIKDPLIAPVPCNATYWVYSDNLWSGYALQPFNEEIADNVTDTVQQYIAEWGWPMFFEVCIGKPIPTVIHAGNDTVTFDGIVNGTHVQVLLDRHQPKDNPSIFNDTKEYADLCFYMTLNYWIKGDSVTSKQWFRLGEDLWNNTTNKGFYDKAAKNVGCYQNYKLGLFLLAQRVTEFDSNITDYVETVAWSYQNGLGGIASQSWLNGSVYGTANAEATSALLLAYNEQLVLNIRMSYVNTVLFFVSIIMILILITVSLIIILKSRRIRQRIIAFFS